MISPTISIRLVGSLLVAATLFFVNISSAHANFKAMDGNTMLPKCKKALKIFEKGKSSTDSLSEIYEGQTCIYFMQGVIESHLNTAQFAAMKTTKNKNVTDNDVQAVSMFCLPADATPAQLLRIYVKYMEENPEALHFSASVLLSFALAKPFPCGKQ